MRGGTVAVPTLKAVNQLLQVAELVFGVGRGPQLDRLNLTSSFHEAQTTDRYAKVFSSGFAVQKLRLRLVHGVGVDLVEFAGQFVKNACFFQFTNFIRCENPTTFASFSNELGSD